jgi:hypothetical protein
MRARRVFSAVDSHTEGMPTRVVTGGVGTLPDEVARRADEVVGWNERIMVDAIRRQARHEETTRWDVIEFNLE